MTPGPHPLRRPQPGGDARVAVFGTQDEARRHGARGNPLTLDGMRVVTPASWRPLHGLRVSSYVVIGHTAAAHPDYSKLIAMLDRSVLKAKERAMADVRKAEALLACECGHGLGEHNGEGCYARLSYEPLVTCPCVLTDERTHAELLAPRLALIAGEHAGKLAAIEAILAPKPRCRDCADMETDRCQDKPDGDYCNPLEAIRAVLRGEGS